MWLLFYPKTCQKQQLFSHCCFPQTTLCQDYVIAALENCGVKALASLPGFFKVLVNPSHFLQEVSQKLGGVMFLLHFSDINHYYVHARSQVLPQGGFDAELASQDSQQWGHPAAVPDRWCMQRATASPTNSSPKEQLSAKRSLHHASNNSQQPSTTVFIQLMAPKWEGYQSYSKMFGGQKKSPSKPLSTTDNFIQSIQQVII